jgi:imidazole glycerol-phosphate synthase subunit HisF
MTYKRIIPLFLLKGKRLVKGTRFRDFVDVGDPLSQAMIYDAQGADEIAIVDIEASARNSLIDPALIHAMISKTRLPISAGGGIKSVRDGHRCFDAGADKIIVNTHALLDRHLIKELAEEFGSQSVVVSIDVQITASGWPEVVICSGSKKLDTPLEHLVTEVVGKGAGEIILTVVNREGLLQGFEDSIYKKVRPLLNVPLIASGGAGCYDDIVRLFKESDVDGCAIGKMLALRDYDIVRIKSYLKGKKVSTRDA